MDYFRDCKKLWKQRIMLVLQLEDDSERISIGSESAIRKAPKGDTSDLLLHSIKPYGFSIIQFDRDIKNEWISVLDNMDQAHKLMADTLVRTDGILGKTDVNKLEENIKSVLSSKIKTGDPLCQYVAMKLWNEYWMVRGKKGEAYDAFSQLARNLIRPFSSGTETLPECNRKLYRDNPVFRWSVPQIDCDSLYPQYAANNEKNITIEWSLLPLKRLYADHCEDTGKVIVECKECGAVFVADSLKHKYCSVQCKNKAIDRNKRNRLSDPNLARQNTLCRDAYQYWFRTIEKARQSGRYSEEQLTELQEAMVEFRKSKNALAKECRENKITTKELQNALVKTYGVLDKMLESMQND